MGGLEKQDFDLYGAELTGVVPDTLPPPLIDQGNHAISDVSSLAGDRLALSCSHAAAIRVAGASKPAAGKLTPIWPDARIGVRRGVLGTAMQGASREPAAPDRSMLLRKEDVAMRTEFTSARCSVHRWVRPDVRPAAACSGGGGRGEPQLPTYDIERTGEDTYRVTLAVAGFVHDR